MSKQTTRSRNKTKAAADVLSDLATPIPEGGKPGLHDWSQTQDQTKDEAKTDDAKSQEAKTKIVVQAEEPKTAELMVVSSEVEIPDDAPMTEAEKADYQRYMSSIKSMCIETARMILEPVMHFD
jgi:hypothetical protein